MNKKHRPHRLLDCIALLYACLAVPSTALAADLPGYDQYRGDLPLSVGDAQVLCAVRDVMDAHTLHLSDGSEATVLLLLVREKEPNDITVQAPVLLVDLEGTIHYRQVEDYTMTGKLRFADFDGDGTDDILVLSDYASMGGAGAYAWSIHKFSPKGIVLLYDDESYNNDGFQAIPRPGWQIEVRHKTLPFSVTFPLPADHEYVPAFDDDGTPRPELETDEGWLVDGEYPIMYMDPCFSVYPVPQKDGPALLGTAQYCYTGSHNGSGIGNAHTLLRFNTQNGQFEAVEAAFEAYDAQRRPGGYTPPWTQLSPRIIDSRGHSIGEKHFIARTITKIF